MTPEHWEEVKRIFDAALQQDAVSRGNFLSQACGGNDELQKEVEKLLAAHEQAGSFMTVTTTHPSSATESTATASNADRFLGRVLSHYRIETRLGSGGMGVVYRATDLKLGRAVGIKLLSRQFATSDDAKARFLREARAASALDHPNIGSVYDIAEEAGELFIVMALYQGETLKQRLEKGSVPLAEVTETVRQIALGLQAAHGAGVIHRDIKPANVLMTHTGTIKILDFGLAKMVQDLAPENVTRAGEVLGTLLYMSPEQARGQMVDRRTDLWSLGVLAYELIAGVSPFHAESDAATAARILHDEPPLLTAVPGIPGWLAELIAQMLKKDPAQRPQSASDVLSRLNATSIGIASTKHKFRRILIAVAAALAACGLAVYLARREARIRWAREKAIPQIAQLVGQHKFAAAFSLAEQAERAAPSDPVLARLWPEMSRLVDVETVPAGADVYVKDYESPDAPWMHLGQSPLSRVRLPLAFFRWRITKDGFVPLEAAASGRAGWALNWFRPIGSVSFTLDRPESAPAGMLRIPSGQVEGDRRLPPVELPDYFIDKYEVTNKQFKQFIEAGGYRKPELWKHAFVKDGRALSWQEAVGGFRDRTGRPGPMSWELGDYPEGEGDLPVTGVSWYEAAAYATFAGKSLPTVYHWNRAAGIWATEYLVPASNFSGVRLAAVGSHAGLGPYGTHDMAGNAKEWCWNAVGDQRYILGGAFDEPAYMFGDLDAQSPFVRSARSGFRLVKYIEEEKVPKAALDPLPLREWRDYAKEKPVPEDVFRIYKSLFAYDKAPLNSVIETIDDGSERWRKEKVSFSAAYGNERVVVYLFTPRRVAQPYQPVIYFPGTSAFVLRSSQHLGGLQLLSFIVKSGRALLFPIYKSTYERGDGLTDDNPAPTTAYRDHLIQWSKDLGRTIDYIESRSDLDQGKIAFYGLSTGAEIGPTLAAVEDRIKVGILVGGGLMRQKALPEVDQINFVSRARQPMLMVNGRYDYLLPLESAQLPMFRLLGAAPNDKRHAIFETGHMPTGNAMTKEILDWLDRYLGPVH